MYYLIKVGTTFIPTTADKMILSPESFTFEGKAIDKVVAVSESLEELTTRANRMNIPVTL